MLTPEHSLAVLEEAPIGVLVIAASGRIEWLNAALARWLELPAERLIGLAGEALPAPHLQALVQLPEQLHVPRVADTPLQLHCHATTLGPLRVGYFSDVTAQHHAEEESRRLGALVQTHMLRDPLTGLLNARGVAADLERQVARSRRYGNPLSVLLLRPRGYEGFALRAGPEGATALLIGIAHLLRDQVRWADSVGRLEEATEFALVLPEADAEAAGQLAAKLRKQCRELTLPDGSRTEVKADFGWVAWRRGDDPARLLHRARAALAAAPG